MPVGKLVNTIELDAAIEEIVEKVSTRLGDSVERSIITQVVSAALPFAVEAYNNATPEYVYADIVPPAVGN